MTGCDNDIGVEIRRLRLDSLNGALALTCLRAVMRSQTGTLCKPVPVYMILHIWLRALERLSAPLMSPFSGFVKGFWLIQYIVLALKEQQLN